jgi:excinuclease ABC subunit A
VLVAGTPETVATTAGSHTGHFLAPHLSSTQATKAKRADAPKRTKAATKHIASADKHRPMPRKKRS